VLANARGAQLSCGPTACEVKSRRVFRIALIALSIFAFNLRAADLERSVSPSGQFIIYGADAVWRGAISKLAEQTKSNMLAILQRRDEWAIPAVINLQARAANLPEIPNTALRLSQTGSGLKLQLDLAISREMNSQTVEREILRVILLEMIYRKETGLASGASYVEPPDWLLEGLLALTPNRDRSALINALAVPERIPSLDEFLRERPHLLDPVAQLLYRAYSFALVQLLAEVPARLGRYIDNLASASNDPLADLRKGFPQLAGKEAESMWKSKIGSVKESDRSDLPTYWQTNEKLDALLGSLSLEDFCQKRLSPEQKLAIKKFGEQLLILAARANPALRPIVWDYQKCAAQLSLGKSHGVAKKLADFKTLREQLSARMSEIDDYMNWFEATQLQTSSGLFENLDASSDAPEPRPRRKDAFSTYLDAMESQF
jgi:hypothetical protein